MYMKVGVYIYMDSYDCCTAACVNSAGAVT